MGQESPGDAVGQQEVQVLLEQPSVAQATEASDPAAVGFPILFRRGFGFFDVGFRHD
jgi:hypothetical protein